MGLVLAIDPGRRQGKALDRLTQEFRDHEVVIATSGDEALAVLDGVVPDLVLFPLFFTPGDEAKLQSRLEALGPDRPRQALTLPLHAFFNSEAMALRPAAVPPAWYYWFKPLDTRDAMFSEPRAFSDAVRADVQRPRGIDLSRGVDPLREASGSVPAQVAAPLFPPAAAPVSTPVVGSLPTPVAVPTPPLASAGPVDVGVAYSPTLEAESERTADAAPTTADWSRDVDSGLPGGTGLEEPVDFPQTSGRSSAVAWLSAAGRGARAMGRAAKKVGPVAVGSWRLAQRMPRAAQVGVPVAVVILTLGMTGHVGRLLSVPGRLADAAKTRWFPDKPKTGTAEIQTVPDGAQVWYQGRQLGVTPLRTEFAVGSHEVELRYRNTTRTVVLDVTPGNTFVQRVEWGAPRAVGKLRIESDPSGAVVMIDGRPRGATPLTADDLVAGRHTVDVTMNGNTVQEAVDVKAGKTTTLRTSVYKGWLALFSPIELNLAADGKPLTLDDQNRAMLSAGTHQLTLQNRALDYSDTRTIEIKAGDTTPLSVVVPKTTLSVTTSSPADVWIDGERAGEAPIVGFPVDIGTRDVLVRSVEHGERHTTVTATTTPVSVTVDFASSAP